MPELDELKLRRRVQVTAQLVFDTGWRIGTGKEGITSSDLGVLLDLAGRPLLPGSSLKGKLRSTCEALAEHLGLWACFLNASSFERRDDHNCVGDVNHYSRLKAEHRAALEGGAKEQLEWIRRNTCDVCKLFGSPVRAARLRCADGILLTAEAAAVQVRDGVVLDRDSHNAVNGLKYDYEVLPAGTAFEVRFDLDNPTDADEALFGAALFEWAAGSSLGGFTSRGLGRFHLEEIKLRRADLENAEQRRRYLTSIKPEQRLTPVDDWQGHFTSKIDGQLKRSA
jgi:CRISPR-associated RAMP protein (TIGR02581 family)